MALGEAESSLFGLFTNQSANVFEPVTVFCSKKWLVLKPLISTFSGWF